MNRKLKADLQSAFDAPPPTRKAMFLSSINYPKTTYFGFALSQAGYIRKRVWVVTSLAIVPALLLLLLNNTENVHSFVWILSSFLPFIALAGISEITRSSSYNMAELESGCKYSFSNVVLARLGILGFANMIMFAAIILMLRMAGGIEVIRLGVYLFVPYLLSCSVSLFALNRMHSKDGVYICGGISGIVSIANALFSYQYREIFSYENIIFWLPAFIALLIWTTFEVARLIKKTEEQQWNLSLTA